VTAANIPLVVAVEADQCLDEVADMAVDELRQAHLIALPTETVYGLAADPSLPGTLERIYAAKGRDLRKPIAWFVRGEHDIAELGGEPTALLHSLAQTFWPGPLTVVVRCGAENRGFRVPAHRFPLRVLEKLSRPLAVTSANRSGEPPARTPGEVLAALGDHVSAIFTDPPQCQHPPSTVVDLTVEPPRVLREGAIPVARLREVLGDIA